MPRARRKPAKQQEVDPRPWPSLTDQQDSEGKHHSPEENRLARTRCRQLLDGGHGAISWSELLGER